MGLGSEKSKNIGLPLGGGTLIGGSGCLGGGFCGGVSCGGGILINGVLDGASSDICGRLFLGGSLKPLPALLFENIAGVIFIAFIQSRQIQYLSRM